MSYEFFNIYTTAFVLLVFVFLNLKKIKSQIIVNEVEVPASGRIYFFDFLKGVSIVGVVLMHFSYFLFGFSKPSDTNIIYSQIFKICRFAVPFFIISSGFLLRLDGWDFKSFLNFYRRKFVRLILPYFIFCLVIFIIKNKSFVLVEFSRQFVFGAISLPYYFLVVLIQFYLLYPLLVWLNNKYNNFVLLLSSFIISFIALIYYRIENFPDFLPYLFYFEFGIFLKKYLNHSNIVEVLRKSGFFVFSIYLLVLYFLIGLLGIRDLYSNFGFAYSVVLFLLAFNYKAIIEKIKIYPALVYLGKNSLYIYLAHYFILEVVFSLLK